MEATDEREQLMRVETRIFNIYRRKYGDLEELARVMGISVEQLGQFKNGSIQIDYSFILGSKLARPPISYSECRMQKI